jgi:hypothetical protein
VEWLDWTQHEVPLFWERLQPEKPKLLILHASLYANNLQMHLAASVAPFAASEYPG